MTYRHLLLDRSPDRHVITVTLNRRAYSPVLRQSDLSTDITIPWWQNRPLRFRFA